MGQIVAGTIRLAAVAVLVALLPVASAAQTGWRVSTSRSEMTDQPTVVATLVADAAVTMKGTTVRPSLIARCREGRFEAFISVDNVVLDSDADDESFVRVRWDDGSPLSEYWGIATSQTSIFAKRPTVFFRTLASARRFRIEVTPWLAGPVVVSFTPRSTGAVARQLQAACPREAIASATPPATATPVAQPAVVTRTYEAFDLAGLQLGAVLPADLQRWECGTADEVAHRTCVVGVATGFTTVTAYAEVLADTVYHVRYRFPPVAYGPLVNQVTAAMGGPATRILGDARAGNRSQVWQLKRGEVRLEEAGSLNAIIDDIAARIRE